MANCEATISWRRNGATFTDKKYSRSHTWQFDGGAAVLASASPQVIRPPLSDPAGVDPEEAFVAALASCHMLWFLAIACKRGFVVESYDDAAQGLMGKNDEGKTAMTQITLRPRVAFAGENVPDQTTFAAMHDEAHKECYIANSVKSKVTCEPQLG